MSNSLFVKICGLKTERDVDTAVEAGADAIGFVFSHSPRRVDAATAARLCRRVPENVLTVGVFREEPLRDVRAVATEAGIRAVQLHGPEDRGYYADLATGGWTLIRAAAFGDTEPRFGELGEDMLLLDAPVPGSGVAWDWTRGPLADSGEKWLLAGGLSPDNVRDAVAATRPWGVDVSSGVEQSRGVKDPALITAFVKAARAGA
ncbi:phosphoribosylanthranilate isomerase [Streptomyces resistomycificus]|uniref:N-(5'-phosphoribosyl)anthranilate isomerase n=1 Tax=Streptomyces resistomycificus TaxID=67356 RepID=A0A0L8KXU6_9ACTN|nr:phosphoribosylanthranilate isomerase [Streptomyces resistomycificus]KOG30773.1 phosphoribosylanthranilate isomerase [Streptomyces resistomycificus]KUN97900.1 phosphoribosylanthranilate isomerase [Streptomyces resistomycificus]